MQSTTTVALITSIIPLVTMIFKKLFRTEKLDDGPRKALHTLLPITLGIVSSGLVAHANGSDWLTSIAIGLGSGGAAASMRDADKATVGVADSFTSLFGKAK